MISGRGRGKIRPPRRSILNGQTDGNFDTQWNILRSALTEIHSKNASTLSFEQIYRASYKVVLKKEGDRLYDKVREFEEQWFGTEVMPKIRLLITKNLVNIHQGVISGVTANERRVTGEEFLKGLKHAWEDHILTMNMTTDVLMYMDRVYCADNRKASIFITSMGLFRDNVLRHSLALNATEPLLTFDILNAVILDQIGMERDGDVINKTLIRSCFYILEGLYENDEEKPEQKLYLTTFEPEFLRTSADFYRKECDKLLRESDCSTWLRQTQKRLLEEEIRTQTTISLLSTAKIAKVVENELIRAHLDEFLAMEGSGIKAMIDNDKYEDLTLLYQLVARIDSTKKPLKEALQKRVVELGLEINKTIENTDFSMAAGPEDGEAAVEGADKTKRATAAAKQTAAAIRWVDEILTLKDKFDNLWKRALNQDLILQTALTKSFSDFFNLFSRCGEYVSLFIDDNLKRGIKGKTEAEIETVLDKATTLLRYIQDKDLFERYYQKHLARRLLHGKSESQDAEKSMISRMKLEIGNSFTIRLEGMFKDMSMSDDLTNGYRTHIASLGDERKPIELGINVLTTIHWPMDAMGGSASRREDGTQGTCNWPMEITKLQESFRAYYLKERNGRRLTWLPFIGSADIKCFFPKIPGKETGNLSKERRYDLNLPTYGMIVLMLFNDLAEDEKLSFDEIQSRTEIPVSELSRALFTLSVLPKARVLVKYPADRERPKSGDTFGFNPNFVSKTVKIKAPNIGSFNKVEGEEERRETDRNNDKQRGVIIDTAVVRIMKARKQSTHQQLVAEVISQLSTNFKPEIVMVKQRIESLMEREYLERVDGVEPATYKYLA